MSAENERDRVISLQQAMARIEAVFVEAQARRAADRAAEVRDGDDGSDSSGLEAMSAVAAGVVATLTRERDEARETARDLLRRSCISLADLAGLPAWLFDESPETTGKDPCPWPWEDPEDDAD